MFSDHDNPVTAAAAAPAHEAQSAAAPENPTEQQAVHETPSQRTEEDPKTPVETSSASQTSNSGASGDDSHAKAEARERTASAS